MHGRAGTAVAPLTEPCGRWRSGGSECPHGGATRVVGDRLGGIVVGRLEGGWRFPQDIPLSLRCTIFLTFVCPTFEGLSPALG